MQRLIDVCTRDGASLEVWAAPLDASRFRVVVNGTVAATFDATEEPALIQAVAQRMGPALPASLRAGEVARAEAWVADFPSSLGERIWILRTRPNTAQAYDVLRRGSSQHGPCDLADALRAMAFYGHVEPRAA